MKLKDVMEKLESFPEFVEWKKSNTDCYLAHAFMELDKGSLTMWQIGFYNPKKDNMTTFMLEGDKLKISPELNIFKKPGATVEKLDVEKVKIGSIEALETAEEVMAKDYPKASPIKVFFIIQNLADEGAVFNITFVTQDFKTVNVRISSEDGKVLRHSVDSLLQMQK